MVAGLVAVEVIPLAVLAVTSGVFLLVFSFLAGRRNTGTQHQKTRDQHVHDGHAHIRILTIAVPASTTWQPIVAHAFMDHLFALKKPLTFGIVVTADGIFWKIMLREDALDTVTRTLLTYYPHADVSIATSAVGETQHNTHRPAATLQLLGSEEFFKPLCLVRSVKELDPLAGLIGAMANLSAGEHILYQLHLGVAREDYQAEGQRKLSPGVVRVLCTTSAAMGGNHAAQRELKEGMKKYEHKLQDLYEEKVNAPLRPVDLAIAIRTPDPKRYTDLRAGFLAAMKRFANENGNTLVAAPPGTSDVPKAHRLILCPQEVAALWRLPTEQCQTPQIAWSRAIKAPLPAHLANKGGEILVGENSYHGRAQPVYLTYADCVTHINIVGKTRVGKTTFLHNLIHQDIASGKGVAVIDPHGDLIRDILERSIPPEREPDLLLFDLSDTDHPVPLNLLAVPPGVPHHVVASLSMGVLKKLFAGQWSATRMEDALYSALVALTQASRRATIRDIPKLFLEKEYRDAVLAKVTDEAALEFWVQDFNRMSERNQREVARPILHRIRVFYRNPVIKAIVTQPQSINLATVMDEGKLFLASLAGAAAPSEANTIGALLITQLQLAAMSRANRARDDRNAFYLFIDEVQNFVTTSLSTMFSEAAKYGLSLTVANQYLAQLEGGTLEAILGNTGTTVMFACGAQDAADFGRYLHPVFGPHDLTDLDRFQTIVRMQRDGQTVPPFSMHTLPPPPVPDGASERASALREHAWCTTMRALSAPASSDLGGPAGPGLGFASGTPLAEDEIVDEDL